MTGFHILLTTDLSDESTRAFDRTAALARRMDADITLLHALEAPHLMGAGFPGAGAGATTARQMDGALACAADRLRELRAMLPEDLRVTVRPVAGDEIPQIVADFAREHDVDVIAMATHGRSGLRRVLMGSVAEAVLHRSSTPVLLFPPERDERG